MVLYTSVPGFLFNLFNLLFLKWDTDYWIKVEEGKGL